MNELKQAITSAFDKIVESGAIEEKIQATIQKTIETIINDLFRDYSDFSKNLKTALSEKMKIDLDKIDLPAYNKMIENHIKSSVNDTMTANAKKLIEENLKSILTVEEKDWKLSEFIEEFKKSIEGDNGERQGEKISLHVGQCGWPLKDSYHVYIDEDGDRERYRCEIRMYVSNNKIVSVDWRGEKWDKDVFLGWKHNIEATLFRIYAQGKDFVVDEDDVDVYFSEYD